MELKLTKIGNSVGMVIPKEVRDKLKLDVGDKIFLTETPDGYKITPFDEEFAHQMEVARKIMKERRGALRELAK